MGRKRKEGTDWLPPFVYIGKSSYEYRPKVSGERITITLCSLKAKQHVVWNRYEEEKRKLEMRAGTVAALFEEFFESPDCKKLAASTVKKYQQNAKQLNKVFGKASANSVKPEHVRKYMDLRGKKHEVAANREKSFMSRVFSWAYERGKVSMNPCKGVRKFTEKSRDRYIEDNEYQIVYDCASPIIQAITEISYCCAARISDVLDLQQSQISDEGIEIKQEKTGKVQIKNWSPRLRAAVKKALEWQDVRSMTRVVANKKGEKITYDSFNYHWNKAKKLAKEKHPEMSFDFTFHDNKAKSISDVEGTKADKQKFSGHKSESMVDAYDRKKERVDTH